MPPYLILNIVYPKFNNIKVISPKLPPLITEQLVNVSRQHLLTATLT